MPPAFPPLLKRCFIPSARNRVWCSDISNIRIQGGRCYLALVTDLYSRRVWAALSLSSDTAMVCRAMDLSDRVHGVPFISALTDVQRRGD